MHKDEIHLLFLITSLKYGGAERVLSNLANYFAGLDKYKVSIMLLEDGVDYTVSDRIEIIKLHPHQNNLFLKFLSLILDPFRLKKVIKRCNIDVVSSFMHRPNIINMLSKLFGSRHISVVNLRCPMAPHYDIDYTAVPKIVKDVGKILLKGLWRYTDKTIANSKEIKDEAVKLFKLDSTTVDVIYNPLDIEDIKTKSKEFVKDRWFANRRGSPIIINVGRLTKAKGQVLLLRAFANLSSKRSVYLAIVGDGELKETLFKEAKRLRIADKVYFMGFQKNPYKYIAHSDVFVLSSLYEGFPNVLLEAMACGCPVVAVNCVSGPMEILLPPPGRKGDIIEAEYGLLVNTPKEETLSRAIEYILENSSLSRRYKESGERRVMDFDISIICNKYDRMLTGLIRGFCK